MTFGHFSGRGSGNVPAAVRKTLGASFRHRSTKNIPTDKKMYLYLNKMTPDMKAKIFITSLTFLIAVTIKSQNAVDIPMKNGMVYYSIDHKLENTKKCLSTYAMHGFVGNQLVSNWNEMMKKTMAKTAEVTSKKSGPTLFSYKDYQFTAFPGPSKGLCQDTTSNQGAVFKLTLPTKIKVTGLYNYAKKKIVSQTIEANVIIVFTSKTDYILKIKGFTYKTILMNGYKSETEEHPLGEIYDAFLKDESKSKDQINLFKDFDMMVKEFDRIIKEVFTEMYKVDELD